MKILNIFNQDFDSTIVNLQQCYWSLSKSKKNVLYKKKEYNENLNTYNINKDYFSKSATGKTILDNIENRFDCYKKNFVKFLNEQENNQNKIKKSIRSIYNKNIDLQELEEYDVIVTQDKYNELLVTLTKAHKDGLVDKEKVLELTDFKRIDFKKGSIYVKDNRVNYADCIVINEFNEILLLKRNKLDDFEAGKYCLPGGHVDKGEDFEYAALRELIEETGIKAETAIFSGKYLDNKVAIHYFTIQVKKDDCNIFLDEREHQQFVWVPMEELSKYPLIKNLDKNFQEVILIPTSVINTHIASNIFSYYNNGHFIKSEDSEAIVIANEIYKSIKNGVIGEYELEKHIKESNLGTQNFAIYRPSLGPIYGVKAIENIEKAHRYIKREGGPGKYRYTYPEDLKKTDKIEVNTNDPYTYKGTEVLVNKFGIRDRDELHKKERVEVGEKVIKISKMDFSSSGFKKLHNELFSGLYEWSGKTRTVNLSNGNVTFAPMRFLEEGLNSEFQKIQNNVKSKDKFSDEQWINKAGDHFGEIIFIHPFREGNGRTTRKFIDLFLKEKGLKLNWSEVNTNEYYKASEQAINKADNSLIKELFFKHIVK